MWNSPLILKLFCRLIGIWTAGFALLLVFPMLRPTIWGWAASAAILVLCGIGSLVVLVSALRPIDEFARRTRAAIDAREPTAIQATSPDDYSPLITALNAILERLERRSLSAETSAQQLITVVGSMSEGVLAVDPEERILFANEASRELLEVRGQEIVGRQLMEVTRVLAVREAVLHAFGEVPPQTMEFQSAGAARRTISLRANRLPGDPCPGVVVVLQDVSELRRLETLRRDFVANVSHELKTPLSSIKAYAETLLNGALHDPAHNEEFVRQIEQQADRLQQLIFDLLHLARVETGKESFQIENLSLPELVAISVQRFAAAAQAKQIGVTVESAEELDIRADLEGMLTVLDNLIGNAIKYTPPGGHVRIRWRVEQDVGAIEIEDSGIGIAANHRDRVFERFYRVDQARSREMGGTGLGLSIVKHLVQAFNGGVSLQSELGKGSTFTVRLPRAYPTEAA